MIIKYGEAKTNGENVKRIISQRFKRYALKSYKALE